MPRPKKYRHCEGRVHGRVFKPAGKPLHQMEQIRMGLDELEALRLCDLEGFTQEEAGEKMGVSRGTVQRLVASAREKTVRALVEGAALVFEEKEK
jgi:uncharacterized protein